MRLQTTPYQLLRSSSSKWHSTNGTGKGQQSERMETPMKCHRSMTVPRIHRLLPIFHPRLLPNRSTPTGPYKAHNTMALESGSTKCLRRTMRQNVRKTCITTAKLRENLLPANWCVGVWCGHCTLTRGRVQELKTQMPPHLLCSEQDARLADVATGSHVRQEQGFRIVVGTEVHYWHGRRLV